MGFKEYFLRLFNISRGIEKDMATPLPLNKTTEEVERELDVVVSGGRVSQPFASISTSQTLITSYDIDFNPQVLKVLEHLALYNDDVSKAVENIRAIANTPAELIFPKSLRTSQRRQLQAHYDLVSSSWYENHTGESSLTADVFTQLAIYGCISTESEIKSDLSGIAMEHRVTPYNIRFRLDNELQRNIPVQITGGANSVQKDLDVLQYHYFALNRMGESPYGIPPFISALKSLAIKTNMVENFKVLMEKIGMLGFMSLLLSKPSKKPGETDKEYEARLLSLLKEQAEVAKDGFALGHNVGFEGMHKVEVSGNTIDASGGKDLMEIIDKMSYTGLKQDPNLFGRNYSTTETYGKVILRIMASQAKQYQQKVAEYKAKRANLEFLLAGFEPVRDFNGRINPINPFGIKFQFEEPLNINELDKARTEEIKINNAVKKRDEGFATQEQASAEVGYPNPAQKEAPNKTGIANNSLAEKAYSKLMEFDRLATFNYYIPKGCDHESFIKEFNEDQFLTDQYISYNSELQEIFKEYAQEIGDKVAESMEARMGAYDTTQSAFNLVYTTILTTIENSYRDKNRKVIKNYIPAIYDHYRTTEEETFGLDKRLATFDIPNAEYTFIDWRTIDYLEESDDVYLGKFITDPDTQRRVRNFISEFLENGENPLDSEKKIAEFAESLSDNIIIEAWKIERIISTTLNKLRSYAAISYISQAGVEEYEIVEVMDGITCPYCRHMNGRIFKTADAVQHIRVIVEGNVFDVGELSPFATSIPISEFEKLTTEELNSSNINKPPFHPNCRGRVVAVNQ